MRQTTPQRAYISLLCICSFLLASESRGAPPTVSAEVRKVEQLYKQLYFDDAMKICQKTLDAGKNSRGDLVELLKYRGLLLAVRGKRKAATGAFKRLLVLDPTFELGQGHPPRIQRAFKSARRWFKTQQPLAITVKAPEEALRGGAVGISMGVKSDPLSLASRAVLRVRAGDSGPFRPFGPTTVKDANWTVNLTRLPGVAQAQHVHYYVTVLDAHLNELALTGSPDEPRVVRLAGETAALPTQTPPPPKKKDRAWYTHWWIWAAVGTVVAVSTVAIAVTAGAPEDTVDAPVTIEAGGSP